MLLFAPSKESEILCLPLQIFLGFELIYGLIYPMINSLLPLDFYHEIQAFQLIHDLPVGLREMENK